MSDRIQISGLVSRELRARVESLVAEKKSSISAVVAEALERYLKEMIEGSNVNRPVVRAAPQITSRPPVDDDHKFCSVCGDPVNDFKSAGYVLNAKGDPVCWPCVRSSRVTPMSPQDKPRPWEATK